MGGSHNHNWSTDLNELVSSFSMLENEKNIRLVKTEPYADVYEWLENLEEKLGDPPQKITRITTNGLKIPSVILNVLTIGLAPLGFSRVYLPYQILKKTGPFRPQKKLMN